MELPKDALEKSVLIVAHPDDEVLWFGSVLDRFEKIVICFTEAGHWPELGDARRRSLAEHACRDRIVELDVCQVKSHNKSKWPHPTETEYGLKLDRYPQFDAAYRHQAELVRTALEPHLKGTANIFTHNPWGEYGHEDHVQVCRIATVFAEKIGAAVWYNNYVSNKSSELMRQYVQGFGRPYYSMPVDIEKIRKIADTYFRNNAWTWMDDYAWFASECFVKGPLVNKKDRCTGALFPVNFLRLPFETPPPPEQPLSIYRKIRRRLRLRLSELKLIRSNAATD